MSTTSWTWAGARWWTFDVHTHTPASYDYRGGSDQAAPRAVEPRDWLLDYMRAGIDCVAVTDHNTGAWVDPLRHALEALDKEQPEGYRPLTLFPGVEITVNGGVHLLAVLPTHATSHDISRLLGAVGYPFGAGAGDDQARQTGQTGQAFAEVARQIVDAGGIAIPAHVDGPSGLFGESKTWNLKGALSCEHIAAIEVINPEAAKPQLYRDAGCSWTEVIGSDAHHRTRAQNGNWPGSRFTWVKMGTPDLDGLRLALLDGAPLSIQRSDASTEHRSPNRHANLVIESIEVAHARYMGRPEPLRIELNPWLNTIIGGRGTGKSTLVEFLRIILRRDAEPPEAIRADLDKYKRVRDAQQRDGLLTDQTRLSAIYRKGGARFRIQWNVPGTAPSIEQETPDGWSPGEGEVTARFPVRIFSQKQVYQLAKEPGALLRVVDDAQEVGRREFDNRWETLKTQFLALRAKARELEAGLADESRLRGALADNEHKLAAFAEQGHAAVLTAYRASQRQRHAIDAWEESWSTTGDQLRRLAAALVPDPPDDSRFDRDNAADDALLKQADHARQQLAGLQDQVHELAARADAILAAWKDSVATSPWAAQAAAASRAYEALKEQLATANVRDPDEYGQLVQERRLLEGELQRLAASRERAAQTRREADERLDELKQLRRRLTDARQAFLNKVLANNSLVRITVDAYRATGDAEAGLRGILARQTGFDKDIGTPDGGEGLLGRLYEADADRDTLERRLDELKRRLRAIREHESGHPDRPQVRDNRFSSHVETLPPEALDRLDVWFPEDSLTILHNPNGSQKGFKPIQGGSPGQKTAALLAFLLSYGDEPLVLDQPEDDLDNQLIYELIVAQLRQVKPHRQLIIVTHNPNIVVNGDAELVVALGARGGQTRIESVGCLQDANVRDTICKIMEGGNEAFQRRYRRIVGGGGRVRQP